MKTAKKNPKNTVRTRIDRLIEEIRNFTREENNSFQVSANDYHEEMLHILKQLRAIKRIA